MIHNYFRNNSAARRIIFHAINHTGLGHLSRLTAIASAVREIAPDTALLFIVDGSSHGILETANIPFISLSFLGNVSDWPLWSADRKERLMPSLAGSIIRTMSPELLVFDSFSNHALLSSAHREGVPLAVCIRKVKNID